MVSVILLKIQIFSWMFEAYRINYQVPFGLNLAVHPKLVVRLGVAIFRMTTSSSLYSGLEMFSKYKRLGMATACWFGADNACSVTDSTATIGTISISPNTVGAYIKFSRLTELQSTPDIE